jgi:hypothetical protein
MSGSVTVEDPWALQTPPLTSTHSMHRDTKDGLDVIVCTVGKTVLLYDARCIEELHAMLAAHGDWMDLGAADEQKPAKDGTVEAWGRSPDNPRGGWYGLKKGLRGRFGMYVPPLLEELGLAEVEHNPRNNRMRAIASFVGCPIRDNPGQSRTTQDNPGQELTGMRRRVLSVGSEGGPCQQ